MRQSESLVKYFSHLGTSVKVQLSIRHSHVTCSNCWSVSVYIDEFYEADMFDTYTTHSNILCYFGEVRFPTFEFPGHKSWQTSPDTFCSFLFFFIFGFFIVLLFFIFLSIFSFISFLLYLLFSFCVYFTSLFSFSLSLLHYLKLFLM